jgi:hypothetical protein
VDGMAPGKVEALAVPDAELDAGPVDGQGASSSVPYWGASMGAGPCLVACASNQGAATSGQAAVVITLAKGACVHEACSEEGHFIIKCSGWAVDTLGIEGASFPSGITT